MRTALEQQGALLGSHQRDILVVNQSLATISQTLIDLNGQLQTLQDSVAAGQGGLAPPLVTGHLAPRTLPYQEPRLPAPQPYRGEPGTCRSFLSQCSLAMELQASRFPTGRSQVAYVVAWPGSRVGHGGLGRQRRIL